MTESPTETASTVPPAVAEFTNGVVVHEVNGAQVVRLEDFQTLANIAQGLENGFAQFYQQYMDGQDENFQRTKRFALEATIKRFSGMEANNEEITRFYELCINLLEADWNVVNQGEDSQPPVGESDDDTGSILDDLTSGN